jgi:subfamily B ATP-binding cassette protein MsbA
MNDNKKSHKLSMSNVRHAFITIVWPRRKLLFLGLLLMLINTAAGLVLPGSTKYLIDYVITPANMALLKWLLIVVSGAIVLQAVTSFLLNRLLSIESQNLISLLRAQMQKHIIHLPLLYFSQDKSGALLSRIMNDVGGVRNLVGQGMIQLISGILRTVVSLIILINISPVLTLYTIVPLIILGLIFLKTFTYTRPIFRKRGEITAEVTGRLSEALNGIRVIKGFNAEAQEVRVFQQGVNRIFKNAKQSITTISLVNSLTVLLTGMVTIVIMGVGSSLLIEVKMTIGDFFAFMLYLGFLIVPIIQMSDIGSQITEAFAGLDRMEEIMKLEKEGEDKNRTLELNKIRGDIVFENVIFSYEEGKEGKVVLNDISFNAPPGSVTALVGSSGSGKTTIAGLAASFLQPDKGMIRIDGIDLSEVKLESYRSQLGVVLQDDFLFEGTIRENILYPRPDASEEELEQAVKAAHVKEFVDRFKDGLETRIGERGVKLSGGQRQRVAIARAILANPMILILDEATSNLDTESELYIQQSLAHLMKGRTTFVIAHRLSTIRQADRILVIEDGQIAEQGTHDFLIREKGRYHQLYMYQSRI